MRNKTTIIAACAMFVLMIAVAASARDTNAGRAIQKEDAPQTAKVELTDNGFEPASLKLKQAAITRIIAAVRAATTAATTATARTA